MLVGVSVGLAVATVRVAVAPGVLDTTGVVDGVALAVRGTIVAVAINGCKPAELATGVDVAGAPDVTLWFAAAEAVGLAAACTVRTLVG